jgi:hypothetical protein
MSGHADPRGQGPQHLVADLTFPQGLRDPTRSRKWHAASRPGIILGTMTDYDGGFKIVARLAGQGLSRMGGVSTQGWQAIGDTVQSTERLADRAFRAQNGDRRFIVSVEAYTRWAESAVWSVLAKSGLLSERERLPTRSLIFILLPQGYQPQNGQFRLEAEEGQPTQQIWFREVCLWQEQVEPWWEHYPGMLALTPLCRHECSLPDAIARAAAAIKRREMDSLRRADLLTTLGIFGRLKDRTLDVLSIIGREQMRDSVPFQKGERIQARKSVLLVLRLRFGDETVTEFEAVVNRMENLEQLEALHKLAVQSRRVSQFRKAFPTP